MKATCDCGACQTCKNRPIALRHYYQHQAEITARNIEWNKKHREQTRLHTAAWRARNPEKVEAHRVVRNALRRGELERGPCAKCGRVPAEAHHDDYGAPLAVTWLCRVHHRIAHRSALVAA